MKIDYEKLTRDLTHANKVACEAVTNISDDGTCNLDQVFLKIPRARETKVLEAIKAAGLHCRHKDQWIYSWGYFITPNTDGQANKRSKACEVMKDTLKELGYDVIMFWKMD